MNPTLFRLSRYFLDLGFYGDQVDLGVSGLQRRRIYWSVSAYLLLVAGLLSQQAIDLNRRPLTLQMVFDWRAVFASAIVGVALFAPFMHWLNRRRRKPSWEHVLWAFSFGFFVNLSTNFIWKKLL
jgi:hypothetical protein